jgi:hypothetical protein
MLAVPAQQSREFFDSMLDVAAATAAARLSGAIRLARCEGVELRDGYSPSDVALECWPVTADHRAVVVVVFATAVRPDGGQNMAATGRFTFTNLTNTRKP